MVANEDNSGLFKPSYYRVLFPAAILGTLVGWGLQRLAVTDVAVFEDRLLIGTAAWFALMGVFFWVLPSVRRALEMAFCAGLAVLFAVRLTYAVYFLGPDGSIGEELTKFGFWIPAFFGLQFLWFGIDTGRRTAIGYLAIMAMIALPAVSSGGISLAGVYSLSMLLLAGAVSIFVYHVLGRTLIQLGAGMRAMEHIAVVDHLTGIANRRGLDERLTEEAAHVRRYGGRFSILLIDLDHFKHVNDLHGHEAGDVVLCDIARILAAECRDTDTVGRWGGEEFLAVLHQAGVQQAAEVANRMRAAVAEHRFPCGVDATISIGIAECDTQEPIHELVARADGALYLAKDAGRNRVVRAQTYAFD